MDGSTVNTVVLIIKGADESVGCTVASVVVKGVETNAGISVADIVRKETELCVGDAVTGVVKGTPVADMFGGTGKQKK